MALNLIVMGLPASGKSTFLAALWHIVESQEVECRLSLESYVGDLGYLNKIAEAWRNFEEVPRTSHVGDIDVTLRLVDSKTGDASAIFFPDVAGETFDAQIENRRCRPDFVEGVACGGGVLFFISADVKGNFMSIAEFNATMPVDDGSEQTIGADATVADDPNFEAELPLPEWEPKLVPPQVRIVQLLSDLLRPPFESRPRRLCVVISAWDLVAGMGLTPSEWLAKTMPLVNQFVRMNGDWFQHVVYGVSAQGLSLADSEAVDRAADLEPSRRVRIVGPEGEGHDLTEPLLRLMSEA